MYYGFADTVSLIFRKGSSIYQCLGYSTPWLLVLKVSAVFTQCVHSQCLPGSEHTNEPVVSSSYLFRNPSFVVGVKFSPNLRIHNRSMEIFFFELQASLQNSALLSFGFVELRMRWM